MVGGVKHVDGEVGLGWSANDVPRSASASA